MIDSGGQGSGIPGVLGQLPAAVINLAEQMETATGVDILGSLREGNSYGTSAAAAGASASGDIEANRSVPPLPPPALDETS